MVYSFDWRLSSCRSVALVKLLGLLKVVAHLFLSPSGSAVDTLMSLLPGSAESLM